MSARATLGWVALAFGVAAFLVLALAVEAAPSKSEVRVRTVGVAAPSLQLPEPALPALTAGYLVAPVVLPVVAADRGTVAPLPPIELRQERDTVLTEGQLFAALYRSPWPQRYWSQLVAIARCESSLDAAALGDGGLAVGLLQLRQDAHAPLARVLDFADVEDALVAAYVVFLEARGFTPWACAS